MRDATIDADVDAAVERLRGQQKRVAEFLGAPAATVQSRAEPTGYGSRPAPPSQLAQACEHIATLAGLCSGLRREVAAQRREIAQLKADRAADVDARLAFDKRVKPLEGQRNESRSLIASAFSRLDALAGELRAAPRGAGRTVTDLRITAAGELTVTFSDGAERAVGKFGRAGDAK